MSSHHLPRPSTSEILRYRKQNAVNLGGIFVLEKGLFPSMFDGGTSGDSELDAVVASINVRGVEATKQKWENHWASALSNEDINYLKNAQVNAVRLPIGYFTLGPHFCMNTPFAMSVSTVYENAWKAVRDLVILCNSHGIGVLLDFHALPGSANTQAASGTSTRKAELWDYPWHLDLAIECLQFIAKNLTIDETLAGVIGIQICNETSYETHGALDWYDDAIAKISLTNRRIPIYIPDGHDMQKAIEFAMRHNNVDSPGQNPVIIDTHMYFFYDPVFKAQPPGNLITIATTQLPTILHDEFCEDPLQDSAVFTTRSAFAIFIGEYCCFIHPDSWARCKEESKQDKKALLQEFGHMQAANWDRQACGRAYWTYKLEDRGESEFSFRSVTDRGILPIPYPSACPNSFAETIRRVDSVRNNELSSGMRLHEKYMMEEKGVIGEQWRFADGFHLGWVDGRNFFTARDDGLVGGTKEVGDRIGPKELWIMKRMWEERVALSENCEFGYEWEMGYRSGLQAFEEVAFNNKVTRCAFG